MDKDELLNRMSDDVKQYADNVMDMYNAPFARMMGIEIVSLSKDEAVCEMELRPDLMNSMGRGHGAAIYGLVDHTFAILCNMAHPCTGSSSSINYYRPAQGRLRAICTPVNRSRSLEMYEVRVLSEEGKLVASATNTAFVLKG